MEMMTDYLDIFERALANVDRFRPPRARKTYKKRYDPFTALSEGDFKSKYRFTKGNMRRIIDLVRPVLDFNSNRRGGKISADLQVLCAVRYWGRNEKQDICSDIHGFSQQTMSRICKRVAIAFARLAPQHINMPHSEDAQQATVAEFYRIGRFPGVLGAIDCTHIKIKKIGGEAGQFYVNNKGYHSLNVQTSDKQLSKYNRLCQRLDRLGFGGEKKVVCDAKLKIMDIVARWRGGTHAARIYRESTIKQRFEEGHFNGRLLGDGGYACTPYLLTPVRNPKNPREVEYNRAHTSTRNTVERCIRIWKKRFCCLKEGMSGSLDTIKATIVALAVLQCLAIDMNDPLTDEEDEHNEDAGVGGDADVDLEVAGNMNQTGNACRQAFIHEHF